jgi:hypothetical protein
MVIGDIGKPVLWRYGGGTDGFLLISTSRVAPGKKGPTTTFFLLPLLLYVHEFLCFCRLLSVGERQATSHLEKGKKAVKNIIRQCLLF